MYRQTPDSGVATSDAVAGHPGTASPEHHWAHPAFEELTPALPNELAGLRRKLIAWLGGLPLDAATTHDITLATYEALANVAAHAYPGGHGWARLQASRSGDTLTVTVTDTGRGIPPKRGPRTTGGRGLLLIDKVTDRSEIDTGTEGTTVTMTWRPAALRND